MKAIVAILILCVVGAFATKSALKNDFLAFQRKFHKVYATSEEFSLRFKIFQENMKEAAELNKKNPLAKFGATKFSDLSKDEFRKNFLMPKGMSFPAPPPVKTNFTKRAVGGPDPTNYDWSQAGVVTPVKDQGQCGSCWAFSATETIESYFALAGGSLTELSEEQIVDCDTAGQDQGCNGGFPSGAYQYVQSAGGIDSESSYPYTAGGGSSGSCQFNQQSVVTTVTGSQSLSGESGLYQQLSTAGPVSVCVDASSWQNYQGGILTSCGNDVDHCVQATGYYNYGQSNAYWNVRNSWNTDWGMSGYIQIAIGQDLCSIGDYCTIVST